MVYLYNCVKITRCYNLLHFPPPQPRCTACRILVPWPETESRPWQWKHQVLTTGPPGNSLPRSIFEMSTVGACSSDSFILMALYLLFHSMTMSQFTCPVYCWWSFEIIPVSLQKNAARNECSCLCRKCIQSNVSTSALLTLWVSRSFVVGGTLCPAGG